MSFRIEHENGEELKIYPIGELDVYNTEDFKSQVEEIYLKDKKNILVDASQLDYLDSTGLGALIYILNLASEDGYVVALMNLKPSIRKLFTITKLDDSFEMRV